MDSKNYREEIVAGLIRGSLEGVRVPREEPSEETAESIIRNMPKAPPIGFGRIRAYKGTYFDGDDSVWILKELERDPRRYPIIFHELAHATGHSTRLNREAIVTKRRKPGATLREEILAELSALYLCVEAGMFWSHQASAKEYIESYLVPLKATTEESRAKVLRSIHAEAVVVVDFILGTHATSTLAA